MSLMSLRKHRMRAAVAAGVEKQSIGDGLSDQQSIKSDGKSCSSGEIDGRVNYSFWGPLPARLVTTVVVVVVLPS